MELSNSSVKKTSPKSQCQLVIGKPMVELSVNLISFIKIVGLMGFQSKSAFGFGSTIIKALFLIESMQPLMSVTVSVAPYVP